MENHELDDLDFEQPQPQEAFHIEVDLYDSGEFSNLLVVPCNDSYIITGNNEHVCTLVHNCNEPKCWDQQEGGLDEEIVNKIGLAIQGYIDSL